MNTWQKIFSAVLGAFLILPTTVASADGGAIDELVRSYVEEHMSASSVPGMVFVLVDADGVTSQAFGSADLETGRPMTVTTPLRVGSISKPITAAIALELEAAGALDLDAPVDDHLDVDLSDRYGSASTIRQLLQHRGGYSDAIVGSHHPDPADAAALDEWIAQVPARSIPNDVVASYTSVGYTVAGAAIEGATGESFADVADRVLFGPLGMTGATFAQPAPFDVATGYRWSEGGFSAYPLDATDLVPGAGLTATALDVGAFMGALVGENSPLSEATVDGLLETAGPAPGLRGYTTGLAEWRYGDQTVLYHEGNGIGTTSRMMILPDAGVAMFTSVNGEAMVGAGDPSPQTLFIRDLHREIVERFYPDATASVSTPVLDGRGVATRPATGAYIPTRVDTTSPLRLEALVSQSDVVETSSGISFDGRPYVGEQGGTYRGATGDIRFLEGPDGVTYATTGGTGSYRQAAWWETLTPNAALLSGSLLLLVTGLAAGLRRAPARIGLSMAATAISALAFIGLLGYGLATVNVMELFTGLPPAVRLAQLAALALGASSVLGAVAITVKRNELSARVLGAATVVSAAGLALTGWALVWKVLPV